MGTCYLLDFLFSWPLGSSSEPLLAILIGKEVTPSLVSECSLVALLLMHVGGPRHGWREPSG